VTLLDKIIKHKRKVEMVKNMANKQALMNEIETLPSNIIDEIFHYVLFLKQMKLNASNNIDSSSLDLTLASEHAFAKEWLLPEEDVAWGHL
jgi:hypothetical protein